MAAFGQVCDEVAQLQRQLTEQQRASRIVPAMPGAEKPYALGNDAENATRRGTSSSCSSNDLGCRGWVEVDEEDEEMIPCSEVPEFRLAELEDRNDGVQQQVFDLSARFSSVERSVQDLEQGLHDMWRDQCVRQQVGQVGEQMMRLQMMQTGEAADANNGTAAAGDVYELQSEVTAVCDDVVTLQDRVRLMESGLDKMSKAFSRVCEELAGLRRTQSGAVANSSPGACSANGGVAVRGAKTSAVQEQGRGVERTAQRNVAALQSAAAVPSDDEEYDDEFDDDVDEAKAPDHGVVASARAAAAALEAAACSSSFDQDDSR